ncbi:hypothetical protein [uncultured Salinisphaera sp.]|uniref:hypothetical protein n=1 Tax=uncultured Salinisphaera sp. TaxID=359372 RepID=UPI0032B29E0E|tara:strand:+ start:2524 stop:2847 length:324 start_codon:yes stop_codon:yes gene_type:complete
MFYRSIAKTLALAALAVTGSWALPAAAVDDVGAFAPAPADSADNVGALDRSGNSSAPQTEPDTMPAYPRHTRRLGYDNDDDFSGTHEVQAPRNTNPDRQQLENAFDD